MGSTGEHLSREFCPYWSLQGRNCLLSQGGLYLPVAEHIGTYCEGGNYSSCAQYTKRAFSSDTQEPIDERENRRRNVRVPGRFAFRLAEGTSGESGELLDDAALTVDFSLGGIRFESYRALSKDTKVLFSLNGDFSEEPVRGLGRVMWCRSLDDAPLYHAGISFTDKSVSLAIQNRLGLPES